MQNYYFIDGKSIFFKNILSLPCTSKKTTRKMRLSYSTAFPSSHLIVSNIFDRELLKLIDSSSDELNYNPINTKFSNKYNNIINECSSTLSYLDVYKNAVSCSEFILWLTKIVKVEYLLNEPSFETSMLKKKFIEKEDPIKEICVFSYDGLCIEIIVLTSLSHSSNESFINIKDRYGRKRRINIDFGDTIIIKAKELTSCNLGSTKFVYTNFYSSLNRDQVDLNETTSTFLKKYKQDAINRAMRSVFPPIVWKFLQKSKSFLLEKF